MAFKDSVKQLLWDIGLRLPLTGRVLRQNDELKARVERLTGLQENLLAQLAPRRPWVRYLDRIEQINPIPSMLTKDELAYLYRTTRFTYAGEGAIVDLGSFIGGSTYSLARGLDENTIVQRKPGRIHAYDFYVYLDNPHQRRLLDRCVPGHELKKGDSLLHIFEDNLRPFEDLIQVHAGDILEAAPPEEPIEILFVDAAKTWAVNTHIVSRFFPRLMPERSLVVHQDYYHFHCYWIHVTMQYLERYFRRLESPFGQTAVFQPTRPIPPELLALDYEKLFTKEESVQLMDEALAEMDGLEKLRVMTAKICLLAHYDDPEAAAAVAREVRASPDWRESERYELDALTDLVHAEKTLPRRLAHPGVMEEDAIVGASRSYTVCRHNGRFYAVPRSMEEISVSDRSDRTRAGVVQALDWNTLEKALGERVASVEPGNG